jgi:hypothetical protein
MVQGGLPANFHFSDSSTAFAMAIGGGLDLKLTRSLAFRLLQADYLLTRFGRRIAKRCEVNNRVGISLRKMTQARFGTVFRVSKS